MNLRLRYAIDDAKAVSVPKDNIERAIKKGTGELESDSFDEVLYEGYGPGGVAVLCDILTDNRNRTAPEIRKIFEIAGGKLGATELRRLDVRPQGPDHDPGRRDERRRLDGTRAGGRRRRRPRGRRQLRGHLRPGRLHARWPTPSPRPTSRRRRAKSRAFRRTRSTSTSKPARSVLKLMEALDDHDDVQNVAANFNIPDEALAEIEAG